MTDANRLHNAQAEISAARDAIRIARMSLDVGITRDAMSRAYYAAFHAARALLLLEGVEPKTHHGLLQLLNERVIKPGRLPPRYNLLVTRLQAYREASDYAYLFEASVADVREEIEAAAEFVERAATMVSSQAPV